MISKPVIPKKSHILSNLITTKYNISIFNIYHLLKYSYRPNILIFYHSLLNLLLFFKTKLAPLLNFKPLLIILLSRIFHKKFIDFLSITYKIHAIANHKSATLQQTSTPISQFLENFHFILNQYKTNIYFVANNSINIYSILNAQLIALRIFIIYLIQLLNNINQKSLIPPKQKNPMSIISIGHLDSRSSHLYFIILYNIYTIVLILDITNSQRLYQIVQESRKYLFFQPYQIRIHNNQRRHRQEYRERQSNKGNYLHIHLQNKIKQEQAGQKS
eukprot:TRINITY_DN44654_c0_g1_i1.p2 TRINITY_DN44654_c0_g1~~TRINITY_DN44654_c0_g1_i1.p2  ORF type:complete len:274 (+),score=-26.57 TRINITY_DN44654_c0_g1_i1:81-902(+)